ncbi:hypothetical protein D3C87_1527670 [compost metagenome]
MPQLQQVTGCGIPAFYIVNRNRIAVILRLLVIDQHIGNAAPLQLNNIIILLHRREQNQAVYPVLLDQVVVLVGADAGRNGNGQKIAMQRQHLIQLLDHRIEKGVLQRGNDQANDAGLAAGQAAGRRIGAVIQLFDGFQHLLAVFLADRTCTVDDP